MEDVMAKIKHIALSTQDPDTTARFYIDVFGMKEIGKINNPNTSGYYLSDGHLNLAILKFKNDQVAGVERGKDFSGIHHIGFQVESLDDITERLAAAGAPRRDNVNEALGVGHGERVAFVMGSEVRRIRRRERARAAARPRYLRHRARAGHHRRRPRCPWMEPEGARRAGGRALRGAYAARPRRAGAADG